MSFQLAIQLLLAWLGFVISPLGFFVFGLGLVLFLGMGIIPQVLGVGRKLANFHLWLAMRSINRAAIVVSEHNDIYFKQMSFDDLGVEKINIGDETKDFEDPDAALHYWMNVPFAMADEVHGVLFDPRHSALGHRKHDLEERDEGEYYATDPEWEDFGVSIWKPGVFEMPTDYEFVNLSRVRQLVDGGERAEFPERTEAMYKHSRSPFAKAMGTMKLLTPVFAFLLVLGGLWLLAQQSTPGQGTPSSTIGWGSSLLLLLAVPDVRSWLGRARDAIVAVDWLLVAKYLLLVVPLPLSFGLVFTYVDPVLAGLAYVTMGMGFWLLPVFSFFSRPIAPLAGMFSSLFFRLGFLGYRRPVFEWTPESYRLREGADYETTDTVEWYGLFGSLVGFTYTPEPESWGAEYIKHDNVESRQVATDGGSESTNLPSKYVRTNTMNRDGYYGGFVPKRLSSSSYYLRSAIALARFTNSAVGTKSFRRLQRAKQDHGESSSSISDRGLLYLNAASGGAAAVLGCLIWFI